MNDVSEIYATFLGAALLVLLLLRLAEPLGTTIGAQIRRFFVKHVCYPLLICRRQGTTHLTRLECACLLLYFAANVSCLSLRIPSRQALSSRAGTLFALNATVLYDGGRTNFVVDKCLRVRRAQHELFHRWIGRTAAIEGCIHGIIQLTTSSPDPSHRLRVPLLAFIVALALLSILVIRRRFYEIFLKAHLSLAIIVLVFLWVHITRGKNLSTLALLLSSLLWSSQTLGWMIYFFYRNRGWRESRLVSLPRDVVSPQDALPVWIDLERPWKFRAGQYVYLLVPSFARYSLGLPQAHPYMIAWVENDERILLLVDSQSGFSNDIRFGAVSRLSILIDGPYGVIQDLSGFDKVLFFASGIGVAAHLLKIKGLLHDFKSSDNRIRARRITLVWLLDYAEQENIVHQQLDELFSMQEPDKQQRPLTILIYAPYDVESNDVVPPESEFKELYRCKHFLNVKTLIGKEWFYNPGNMVVTVCGSPLLEQEVRESIKLSEYDVTLFTSEYQPEESAAAIASRSRYSRRYHAKTNEHAVQSTSMPAVAV